MWLVAPVVTRWWIMWNVGCLACSLLVVLAGCTTSSGAESEATALAVVDAAYTSFNGGDTETWVELLERGSYYESEDRRAWAHDFVMDVMTEQTAGGAQYETIDCESRGRGSWEVAHPELNPVEGYLVSCDTTYRNANGNEHEESFEWVVNGGEVVAVRSDSRPAQFFD